MKGEEKQVKKAIEKLGAQEGQNGTTLGDKYLDIMNTIFTTGKIPTDALGFSKERMENIYAQAYRLYNTGMFTEASQMFRLLMVLNPTDSKNYLGLAACLHMRKEFADAAQVYLACGILDMNNPIYPFHASDCYIQMRDRISALLVLELAVDRAAAQPEYQVLKERALLTINHLKKELAEQIPGIDKDDE
jgi:type III secretion system low calcium response chaperone LcrH/SycD